MKILYLSANAQPHPEFHQRLREAIKEIGELTVNLNAQSMAEAERAQCFRSHDAAILFRDTLPLPPSLARDPGRLRYVCARFGTVRGPIPREIITSPIQVTNWGDAPAGPIAEGALALLLAVLKDLSHHHGTVRRGGWKIDEAGHGGSLLGLNVGLYGCGHIGRRFIEMLRPFRCVIRIYDPYLPECPDGCTRVDSLDELFQQSQAVVIHAGLTDETRGTVTAERLAKLPRHGIVINTARGGIIDQDALFRELASGRLRAGLDVIEPDVPLPADHPLRQNENCLLTAHQIHLGWPRGDQPPTALGYLDQICLDNLRRFRDGEPLRFQITPEQYDRMT